jgi:CubicO group peptidase (beta-lactamase class C family)
MTICRGLVSGWLLVCSVSLLAAEPDFSRLEKIALAELKSSKTPGAAIGIVRDGVLIWKKGVGLANVETGQAVDPEMLFRMGSTTKMFTAAAVVTLEEEGKLKLDEPVGKYVTGLHPAIATLTSHQLLTHSAGLTDESIMSGKHDDEALGAHVKTMDATWLFTEPGKVHSYANPGYWLAGLVCERLDGNPYADLMEKRLFRPLGMTRTTLRPVMAMTWPLAMGHDVRGGKPEIVRPTADNAATRPAGQMYSSIPELARFTTAFLDGGNLEGKQVLSPTLIARLTAPHVKRPTAGDHYGYGLSVGKERGVTIWEHGGSRTGDGSTIRMAPEQKVAVIILTNRTGSSLPRTAAAALEMLLPFDSKPTSDDVKPQPLTEKQMAELVGTYTNNRQTIVLAVEDGKLQARRTASNASTTAGTLSWSGDNRLAYYSGNADGDTSLPTTTYYVVRDSSGRPAYLISSGRALKRKDAAVKP